MTKLEINTRGAWRTVCEFDDRRLREVLDAVAILASAVPDANWSLRDNNGVRRWIHISDSSGQAFNRHPLGDLDETAT